MALRCSLVRTGILLLVVAACGSEDRAAYIYDVRTGTQVKKLPGHGDVVSGVAFNPIHPQFASVSYDGTARFYAEDTR